MRGIFKRQMRNRLQGESGTLILAQHDMITSLPRNTEGVMPVFAVRNVDGQLGIVAARNKVDAVERLDEFANFEGCPIRELPELMLLLDVR